MSGFGRTPGPDVRRKEGRRLRAAPRLPARDLEGLRLGVVLGEQAVDALARGSEHVLGALDLGRRARLGDLPRCGKHLVDEIAELDEVVVGLADRFLPGSGPSAAVLAARPASVSVKTRRPDSDAAGSISPSSSSCWSVGYTEPGLGVQLPPLRSEITWMIW